MEETKIFTCAGCGAPLKIEHGRAFAFCPYCGEENHIPSQQMKATVHTGKVDVTANVDLSSLVRAAEAAISSGDYDAARDLLLSAVMSGRDDRTVTLCRARLSLITGDCPALFDCLTALMREEERSHDGRMAADVCRLMQERGANGFTALHLAAFYERLDLVTYCVAHGADVNCRAGANNVTPGSILYSPVPPGVTAPDGTPFVRHRDKAEAIRAYLTRHGAVVTRADIREAAPFGGIPVKKTAYCLFAFLLGFVGGHKFYAGEIGLGLIYALFACSLVPLVISLIEGVIALCKKADAAGYILV